MPAFTVDLNDETGSNVVSIEVARKHRYEKNCQHKRVSIDPDYVYISCRDCKKELNPVEWLAMLAQKWGHVQMMTKQNIAAAKLFEEKIRTKCEKCGQITKIHPPERFRARLHAVECEGSETNGAS